MPLLRCYAFFSIIFFIIFSLFRFSPSFFIIDFRLIIFFADAADCYDA